MIGPRMIEAVTFVAMHPGCSMRETARHMSASYHANMAGIRAAIRARLLDAEPLGGGYRLYPAEFPGLALPSVSGSGLT